MAGAGALNRRALLIGCGVLAPALFVANSGLAAAVTPARGTATRKSILDALRPKMESMLGAPVQFVVRHLKMDGDFAFAIVDSQRPGGLPIRPEETTLADDWEFMDGLTTYALMARSGGRWALVASVTGPTDVAYWGWWDTYRAPRSIFP